MNTKWKLIIVCFLVLVEIQETFCTPPFYTNSENLFRDVITNKIGDSTGIVVGNRTNDSTGVATITISAIQQSIVSTISFLDNTTISNDPPSLLVGKEYSYLIFRTTSDSSSIIRVAVEVTLIGNAYKFQNSVPGKQIHICKVHGACATCVFFKDQNNTITGCGCNGNVVGNGACQQFFLFTH